MHIGAPKEIKTHEYRVGLTPAGVRELVTHGHRVTVEHNAAAGIGIPDDVYRAPETWARRAYPNLSYFHEVDKGGHFAAWEQPELFSAELRSAFKALR